MLFKGGAAGRVLGAEHLAAREGDRLRHPDQDRRDPPDVKVTFVVHNSERLCHSLLNDQVGDGLHAALPHEGAHLPAARLPQLPRRLPGGR